MYDILLLKKMKSKDVKKKPSTDFSVKDLQLLGEINYDRNTTIWLSIVGIALFYVFFSIIIMLAGGISFTTNTIADSLLVPLVMTFLLLFIIFLSQIVILVIHEGVHGLVSMIYGLRPSFGFMVLHKILPVAYTHFTGVLSRNALIILLIAPFASITFACLFLSILLEVINQSALSLYVLFLIAMNGAGCIGDFYIIYCLLGYPGDVHVENPSEITAPLLVYGTKDQLETINEKKASSAELNIRNPYSVMKFLFLFIIVAIVTGYTLSLAAPVLLLITMTFLLPLLGIESLEFLAWTVTVTSSEMSVGTTNLAFLLFIVVLLALPLSFFAYKKL